MMQGWSAAPPTRAQSYNVACAEGHRLQGQRTEGYQALRCPSCGEGIFVLPRSPLPDPPRPASSPRSRMASAVDAFSEDDPHVLTDPPASMGAVKDVAIDEPEVEIDWVDETPTETGTEPELEISKEVAEAPPRPKAPRPSPKTGRPSTASSPPKPVPSPPQPIKPTLPAKEWPDLRDWAWRHRNALLVAAVVLLIVGASWFQWRKRWLEELPGIAEIGRTEGMKRLDAGDFHAAKKLLAEARDAVNSLGDRFEGAQSIRDGAMEAAVFADLAPKGIDEMIEDAATCDPKDWPFRFATLYKGRSVIIDPKVSEVPDPAKPGSPYQVDYTIYFGRGPRPDGKGRIDLTGFRLFEQAQPKVGEQKPFGARYASVELKTNKDTDKSEWVVTLMPDSGVFITHPKALESIGWGSFEPVEEPGP